MTRKAFGLQTLLGIFALVLAGAGVLNAQQGHGGMVRMMGMMPMMGGMDMEHCPMMQGGMHHGSGMESSRSGGGAMPKIQAEMDAKWGPKP
jgi:hypothetical protein